MVPETGSWALLAAACIHAYMHHYLVTLGDMARPVGRRCLMLGLRGLIPWPKLGIDPQHQAISGLMGGFCELPTAFTTPLACEHSMAELAVRRCIMSCIAAW